MQSSTISTGKKQHVMCIPAIAYLANILHYSYNHHGETMTFVSVTMPSFDQSANFLLRVRTGIHEEMLVCTSRNTRKAGRIRLADWVRPYRKMRSGHGRT
mgnify:CR=1 FL=1